MKVCFLFPGQGAQYLGMGRDFFDSSAAVRELFTEAAESIGIDIAKLLFEGSEEALKSTNNAQLAVTLVNLASALNAREHGIMPSGCAGFSLGEWAALRESGVLSLADCFKLVKIRGKLMDECLKKNAPGGMMAVLFLSAEKIAETIAGIPDLYVANYNGPTQTVISGSEVALAKAEGLLSAAGAKKIVRLKVAGPFHSPLLSEAREKFREALDPVEFAEPKIALYSNVTGKRIASAAEAKALASEQITSSVLWTKEEASVIADAYDSCLETGPGTVLCGLWKAASKDIPCQAAGTLDQIAAISI